MTKTDAEEKKKRFNAISRRDRAVTAEMANDYAFALGYLEAFSLAERLAGTLERFATNHEFAYGHSCSRFKSVAIKALAEFDKAKGE